ncbi:hypothetical protein [Fictibacillus enclensis]|uniref:hypothetical protein n=1 Tax=Fictibacillus enclensis TaxID=1017270 RepID=UPI00138F408B|nr:hypothetical protein [Fictibacillus enclensis]
MNPGNHGQLPEGRKGSFRLVQNSFNDFTAAKLKGKELNPGTLSRFSRMLRK